MKKKNILVCDNKKVFMKMFKKKFGHEFEFIDNAVLDQKQDNIENFDKLVLVVYNKFELIEFLKLYKKATNILVCIFNKNLYIGLNFLEEFNDLVLLDGSKTRREIMIDLRSSCKSKPDFEQQFETIFLTQKHQSYTSLKRLIITSV